MQKLEEELSTFCELFDLAPLPRMETHDKSVSGHPYDNPPAPNRVAIGATASTATRPRCSSYVAWSPSTPFGKRAPPDRSR
jgi:hypothetical protein